MKKVVLTIALTVAIFAGCKNKSGEHEPEHGLEALAYTLYSDKSEIFVEFKPLVAGSVSKFAAHFTILGELFKPLTEGTVTVSLIIDGKGIKQTATKPLRSVWE